MLVMFSGNKMLMDLAKIAVLVVGNYHLRNYLVYIKALDSE